MYVFILFGVSLFLDGFHSIDLAQHYYQRGNFNALEMNSLGDTITIDNMYSAGLRDIFIGFVLFGIGSAYFGILYSEIIKMWKHGTK